MLSFASGSAIKRITAGVKARRDRALRKLRSAGRAFTLPTKSASNEKRIHLFNRLRTVSHNFGRFKTTYRPLTAEHRHYFRLARDLHVTGSMRGLYFFSIAEAAHADT